MLEHTLDAKNGILQLRPNAALKKEDFAALAKSVDPYIDKNGALSGILIELAAFPGWESLGAMADAKLGEVAEKLASHFVAAEIKHFAAGQADAARQWIAAQRGR